MNIDLNHPQFHRLKWTDPCPIGQEWKNVPLEDVNPKFLIWCFEQDWCYDNQPALYDFIKRNYDGLMDTIRLMRND